VRRKKNVYQGVYQPGKPGNSREFEKSGKNREIAGNFVNGQGIFVICIFFNLLAFFSTYFHIYRKFKRKNFLARYARNFKESHSLENLLLPPVHHYFANYHTINVY